jgi:hypothetical protein
VNGPVAAASAAGAGAGAAAAAGAGTGAADVDAAGTAGECGVIGDDDVLPGEPAAVTNAGAVPYFAPSDFASLAGLYAFNISSTLPTYHSKNKR